MRKLFIIYDIFTFEVWEFYNSESECIDRFNEMYHGFANLNWIAISLDDMFKNYMLRF